MIREVLDLKYEGAPPISIVAPKFKEKPKLPFKPRPWYSYNSHGLCYKRKLTDAGKKRRLATQLEKMD